MAEHRIMLYPKDKVALRTRSQPVKSINRQVTTLIRDLKDTLMAHPEGIGLAAPQINVHLRVVVVRLGSSPDTDREADLPIALVNPKIVEAADERKDFDGCLSFPGLYADTIRPHTLRVTGSDEHKKPFDWVFSGFDAVLVHHEIDHLDGVLFVDRVQSPDDFYRVHLDQKGNQVRVNI